MAERTYRINLDLPWPPSVNTYWRHPTFGKLAGRHLISQKGREYREIVKIIFENIRDTNALVTYACDVPIEIEIVAYPPDKRIRDIDNIIKSLLDALTYAGIWKDDNIIDALYIYRKTIIPKGMVNINVKAYLPKGIDKV